MAHCAPGPPILAAFYLPSAVPRTPSLVCNRASTFNLRTQELHGDFMTTDSDAKKPYILHVRCPERLREALGRAANRDFTSVSDVARAHITRAMRANGLLDEA